MCVVIFFISLPSFILFHFLIFPFFHFSSYSSIFINSINKKYMRYYFIHLFPSFLFVHFLYFPCFFLLTHYFLLPRLIKKKVRCYLFPSFFSSHSLFISSLLFIFLHSQLFELPRLIKNVRYYHIHFLTPFLLFHFIIFSLFIYFSSYLSIYVTSID